MEHSRRPTRRDAKRPVRSSNKIRPVKIGEPTDDSPLALLRAQLERVDAQRGALEQALAAEKEERAADARDLGEMMARLSLAEGRTRAAQLAAEELAGKLEDARRRASDLEARHGLLRAEVDSLRAESKRARTDAPPRTLPSGASGDASRELEASRAEADRLRKSLEALQKRAESISLGLHEMRELMVQSAALFDELEQRELAIGEIRARSLRDARTLFLRAAGRGDGALASPPPLPGARPVLEDLSEAAELLEEEVRASMRPRPPADK